jgi:hypothetical protein
MLEAAEKYPLVFMVATRGLQRDYDLGVAAFGNLSSFHGLVETFEPFCGSLTKKQEKRITFLSLLAAAIAVARDGGLVPLGPFYNPTVFGTPHIEPQRFHHVSSQSRMIQ